METTHEIASVGRLYHNYAEDRSDEVLEMVVHVWIFFVHNYKNWVSVIWLLKGETLVPKGLRWPFC